MSWAPFLWLAFTTLFSTCLAAVLINLGWRAESENRLFHAQWLARAAWGALGLILVAMLIAASRQRSTGKANAQRFFEDEASRIQARVTAHMQQYEDLLRGCGEFVAAQKVDSALWQRYVGSLNLSERFPNVHGLGFAAYVTQADLDHFFEVMHRNGASWNLSPQGERYDYFIVRLIEPAGDNSGLLGYDLGSELSARTAAERAHEHHAAALTGKMILLDDPEHRAFLLFWPVIKGADDAIQGWTFLRFRQEDLLKGLLPASESSFSLQVFDGPLKTKEALFYNSAGPLSAWQDNEGSPLSLLKVIDVAGRPWALNFTASDGFAETQGSNHSSALILTGLGLLVGAIGFMWAYTSARQRADVLTRELTTSFREREKALVAGPHGLMIADASQPDWPLVYVNTRFERLTGYSSAEALGRNPRFLYGEDRDQKNLDDIRRAVRDQHEVHALLRNYRKDGSPFWNDLYLTPIRNEQGRLTHYAGVLQDVTEREQSERRLATQVSVIRALSESPDIETAAPNILQAICESQGWDLGTFWRVDQKAGVLRCVDVWRPPELEASEFERFVKETTYPKDMGLPGLVWSRAEPLWFSDVLKDAHFPEASIIAKQGLTGACGFPITGAHGVLGVLAFYSRRIWPLNKNLLLLMAGTASRISQELESAHAVHQQQELTVLERGMAEFLGEGLIAMDRDGFCIYANATAGKLLGIAARQLLGQNVPDLLQPARIMVNGMADASPLRRSLQTIQPEHYLEGQYFVRHEGTIMPVSFTTSPILDQGAIQGVVITFVDASQRQATFDEHRRLLIEKEHEIQQLREALTQVREQQAQAALQDSGTTRISPELLAKLRDVLKEIS